MDDSLDDFFAKKDKSKKKSKSSKSKFVAAELLPPSPSGTPTADLEQQTPEGDATESQVPPSSEVKKSKKKRDKDATGDSGNKEDDEWNEIVDEIDYSGLRIQTKNIAKEAAEEAAENARQEDNDDEGKEKSIWNIKDTTEDNEEEKDQEEEEETPAPPKPATPPPIDDLASKIPSRYVPPSQRAGGAATLPPISLKRGPRGKKVAPNISSNDDFPTLGAAPPPPDPDTTNFEQVRGGGRNEQSQGQAGRPRVETSNIFAALGRNKES